MDRFAQALFRGPRFVSGFKGGSTWSELMLLRSRHARFAVPAAV
jgi:hypothetical protein